MLLRLFAVDPSGTTSVPDALTFFVYDEQVAEE